MPARMLKAYLDSNRVKYQNIQHYPAYTAQETAASAHIPGKELAKPVMFKLDGQIVMVVLPATKRVDLEMLAVATGANEVKLATEAEFRGLFPDCELGAMPPFGNIYGIPVWVAKALTEDKKIFFNAGSHIDLIKMAYRDFQRLVHPQIVEITH